MPNDSPAVHRTLYMSAETGRELAERPAAAFLIGGYDGSGNYGDIAQLEAALQLLADLGDGAFALPLVDLRYLESHRRRSLAPTPNFDPARVLAFSLGGADSAQAAANVGLVPASLPEQLSRTVTYIYGGGYLNSRWAARSLEMVEAAEALAARAGVPRHEMISSGLQIEPRWARTLGPEARHLLAGLRQVGVRDERSAEAAAHFTNGDKTPPVLRSGDDAVGVLHSLLEAAPPPPAVSRLLVLNLHLCPGEWVTADPERLLGWLRVFLLALAESSGRRLRLQPVIANGEERVKERATLARFLAGLVPLDATAATPIVLARSQAAESARALAGADLTIGTSYHVALSSLLTGTPAILISENDYYSQKAQGLARDFSLPTALFPGPGLEPSEAARAVLRALADPGGPLRRDALVERAHEVFRRRRAVESELRGELRSALLASSASGKPKRPSVAAEDRDALLGSLVWSQERIAALGEQVERYEEGRTLQEQHLRELTQTVSWRLTRPLRWAKAVLAGRFGGDQ